MDITTTISAPKPSMLDNARSYQNSDPYAPIVRGKAGDQRPVRKGRMRSTPTKPAFTGMTHDSPDKVIGSSSNKFWHGVGLHWHNQFSRCRGPRGPVLIFVVFGILIALVVVTYVSFKLVHAPTCMGAPYLYVTLHSAGNAFKFSRDGCLVTEKVLWHGNQNTKYFRQVTLGQYEDSPVLYAAAKDEVTSEPHFYSRCNFLLCTSHCFHAWNTIYLRCLCTGSVHHGPRCGLISRLSCPACSRVQRRIWEPSTRTRSRKMMQETCMRPSRTQTSSFGMPTRGTIPTAMRSLTKVRQWKNTGMT